MKRLVLFDIDGTVLTMRRGLSKKLFADVFEQMFSIRPDEEKMPDFSGMTDLSIIREVCAYSGIDLQEVYARIEELWEVKAGIFRDYCTAEYITVLPGVEQLIATLHEDEKITLGLLTGNFRRNAYQKLGGGNLQGYFPFGAFGCDAEQRNMLPPIAIERANTHYGDMIFNSGNTFIIGDSDRDIECAKANGIKVIAVATGGMSMEALDKYAPDLLLDDLTDTFIVSDFIRN